MNRALHAEVEQHESQAVIKLEGSSGILEAEQVRGWLDELVAQRVPHIFLDLEQMDSVGALAVAAVAASYAHSHEHSDIEVLAPKGMGLDMLARNHVTDFLPVHYSA